MKAIPQLCALGGAALLVAAVIGRIIGQAGPTGYTLFGFHTRGIIDFAQAVLLLGICVACAATCGKKE